MALYGIQSYSVHITLISRCNMYVEKELCNQEISVLSASTPGAREISRTSKDSLLPEDVHPFPKPGPICERRQRKNVKSRILTNSPIKDSIKQELTRAGTKKKYCKWATNYRNKK